MHVGLYRPTSFRSGRRGFKIYMGVVYVCYTISSVRNEGGGVKGGYPPPPITAQDPGICACQGDPGWVPNPPPPQYQNVLYKLFYRSFIKFLNITRSKTCYKNKWVITKTVTKAL